jgi:putative transposase
VPDAEARAPRVVGACRSLRYPIDRGDAKWALIKLLVLPAKHGGRHRAVNGRELLNAICYVLSTGCQWQTLPKVLPPCDSARNKSRSS